MKKISLITALALASSTLSAASLEEAIKGATINGSSFIRYISNAGENDGGRGYAMRFMADITSGNINNFTFNGGLFYQYGGVPGPGTTSDSAVDGSRGNRSINGMGANVFGISTLWANYAFEGIKTNVTLGKVKLDTPISSAGTDRAVGGLVTSKLSDSTSLAVAYFDSWSADNHYIGGSFTREFSASGIDAIHNIGNNLAAIGLNGNYGHYGYKLWYFNSANLFNSVFGEISAGSSIEFKAQVAYTDVYNSPTPRLGSIGGSWEDLSGAFDPKTTFATSRGLYTLQLAINPVDVFGLRAGFIGSFGDGYGVALNNTASFSMAGKWWYDNFGNGRNGFAFNGQGGIKDTHINIWYLALKGKASIVDLGLDIVGISGKNQFAVSREINTSGTYSPSAKDRTFYEVTPSIDINVAKGAKLSAYYAFVFGQIHAQRFWTQISYNF